MADSSRRWKDEDIWTLISLIGKKENFKTLYGPEAGEVSTRLACGTDLCRSDRLTACTEHVRGLESQGAQEDCRGDGAEGKRRGGQDQAEA